MASVPVKPEQSPCNDRIVLTGRPSVSAPAPFSAPFKVWLPLVKASVLAATMLTGVFDELTAPCWNVSVLFPNAMGPDPSTFASVIAAVAWKKASELLVGGAARPPTDTRLVLGALLVTVIWAL